MADNYFAVLNAINVNGKTEKKANLTYLSWTYAWGEVKKLHPDATYTVYENANGWNYHTDGRTCWVKTGVTVNGIEHIEYLPVMNSRNQSIAADQVTSFDVNKAIQRSITKACARHGLGLYVYSGEDLPDAEEPTPPPAPAQAPAQPQQMAHDLQKAYIKQHASDEQYLATMQRYGENFERLTAAMADKIITKIKEQNGGN